MALKYILASMKIISMPQKNFLSLHKEHLHQREKTFIAKNNDYFLPAEIKTFVSRKSLKERKVGGKAEKETENFVKKEKKSVPLAMKKHQQSVNGFLLKWQLSHGGY